MSTVSKGKGYEREIRRALLDAGFPARRTPRSGATDFAKGDVQFDALCNYRGHAEDLAAERIFWESFKPPYGRTIRTVECKRKKKLPSWLTECLEHDVVALREDGGKTVVVMKLETWLELMR